MFSPFALVTSLVVFSAAFFMVRGAMTKYGLLRSSGNPGIAMPGKID
jgi:hypothetical protein